MNPDDNSQIPESDSFVALINGQGVGSLAEEGTPVDALTGVDFGFSSPAEHDVTFDDNFSHLPAVPVFDSSATERQVAGGAPVQTSVDLPISRSDYNKALFEARMSAVGDIEMKLPWETGIMKQLFDSDDESIVPSVVPPVPPDYFVQHIGSAAESSGQASSSADHTVKSLVRDDIAMPFYSFAVKVLPDRDFFMEDALLWNKAIQKWLQVFDILGFTGNLGRILLAEQAGAATGSQSDVLRDALGIKSPRTAIKRAQTLLRYFTWLQSSSTDWDPWNRLHCLDYLGAVGSHGVPASKGTIFLEALRFGRFVLDLPILDGLISDPQLRGRAQRLMAAKDGYQPARPLKAKELAQLEMAMNSDLDVRDIYLLGSIIFAVLSRSRWSDLRFVDQFWVERVEYDGEPFGFVEARTKFHKTATNLAKKQRFMPLVAPLLGVTTVDWSKHWLAAMQELGIKLDMEPFGAICRAPAHDGSLCNRACTTEEIGSFANRFLKTTDDTAISSHSFKHTTLAWCSSYGLDEPSRTLLGHHELQGTKAMSVYSRDMLTRPLQLYCSMLANIRKDYFRPDESRTSRMVDLMNIADNAGRLAERPAHLQSTAPLGLPAAPADDASCAPTTPLETEGKGSEKRDEDEVESSEIHSTGSSSDSSSEDDAPEAAPKNIPGPVWRNKRSHVVHRCSDTGRLTACGRLVSGENFEFLEDGCSSLKARCGRCFKGEVIADIGGLVAAMDQQRAKRRRDR
jgi:hypothetical protein